MDLKLLEPHLADRKAFMAAVDGWRDAVDKFTPPDPNFPNTVPETTPCFDGECTHCLGLEDSAALTTMGRYVRLAIRFRGADAPFILEFACGGLSFYALVGRHAETHQLEADLLPLGRRSASN